MSGPDGREEEGAESLVRLKNATVQTSSTRLSVLSAG